MEFLNLNMNLNFLLVMAVCCVLQCPLILCKGGRGGGFRGGGSRSFGGSRGYSGGGGGHQNYHGPQTHYNVNGPPRSYGGPMVNSGGFNSGASSSQVLTSALVGAAIGAGTAHLLHSASHTSNGQPMPTYYYNDKFQKLTNSQVPNGKIVCSYVQSNDSINFNATNDNSTTTLADNSTQKMVYICDIRSEYCCNNHCCKKEIIKVSRVADQWKWFKVFSAIMSICIMACAICCLFRYCKNKQKEQRYHNNPWHHQGHNNGGSNYINAYMEPLPMFQQQQQQQHLYPHNNQSTNDFMMTSSGPEAHTNPNYMPAHQMMYHPTAPHIAHQEWSQSSTSLIEKPPKSDYRFAGY